MAWGRKRRRWPRWTRPAQVAGVALLSVLTLALVILAVRADDPVGTADPGLTPGSPTTSAATDSPSTMPRLIVVGGSWMAGSGADRPESGMAGTIADRYGFELVNLSADGVDYLKPGLDDDRLAEPAAGVIVALGLDAYGPTSFRSAVIEKVLTRVRAEQPTAQVIVVGPFWPDGSPTPEVVAFDDAVAVQAGALGLPFIDPIGQGWITGRPEEAGNALRYVSKDGNPTQTGHDYLAGRLIDAINDLGLLDAS